MSRIGELQGQTPSCTIGLQVIGDGAITGGMAYEAMNHAGFLDTNMLVVLNDNQQVERACCPLKNKDLSSLGFSFTRYGLC